MHKEILNYAYEQVSQDNKLIRLSTITTIMHSLIFVFYILYQIYFLYSRIEGDESINFDNFYKYAEILFGNTNYLTFFIIGGIILVIGYYLIPPIAEAILIYYVDSQNKSGRKSIGKGIFKFFPMFEYHSLFSLFNFFVFIVFFSRFWVLGIIDNPFVIFIVIVRFLITFGVTLLLPYSQFFIVLQDKGVRESVGESIKLTMDNVGITLKFVLISYFLYLRFIINILLIVGIPVLIWYVLMKFGYENQDVIKYSIYGISGILILFSAYINGIIEAFFITYRYKVFQTLTLDENLETLS